MISKENNYKTSNGVKGFYVYCIRAHGVNGGKMKGIDNGGEIKSIPFKDIEALVSEVDFSRFDEKKIKNREECQIC